MSSTQAGLRAGESNIQRPEASSYRWVIAGAILPLHVAIGLNLFSAAPLFPIIIEDYGVSRSTVSLLMVLVFLAFTLCLIPGGIVSSRLGTRRAVLLSGLLMSAGVLTPLTTDIATLLPFRMTFGLGGAILLPATASIIVEWFRPTERGVMNALMLAAQGTGVASAMFLSVPLADALEWRVVLMIYGCFAFVATLGWLVLGRGGRTAGSTPQTMTARDVFAALRERNTLLLSFALVGPFAMFIGYTSWLPTYYHEVFDMPLQQATAILALLPLMGVVVNLLSGFLLARLGLHRPMLAIPGLLFPIGAFGAFYFNNTPIILAAIIVLGFSFWLFLPTVFTIAMELPGVDMERVALVTAAVLTIGNASTVISPFMVGVVTDAVGSYVPSFAVLAVMPLTAVVAARSLPETGHRARRRLPVAS